MASILLEQQAEYTSCLGMMNSAADMFDGYFQMQTEASLSTLHWGQEGTSMP